MIEFQFWLIVEGVHLRMAAVHEQEDHPLRCCLVVRRLRSKRATSPGRRGSSRFALLGEQRAQGEGAEAEPGLTEHLPPE